MTEGFGKSDHGGEVINIRSRPVAFEYNVNGE